MMNESAKKCPAAYCSTGELETRNGVELCTDCEYKVPVSRTWEQVSFLIQIRNGKDSSGRTLFMAVVTYMVSHPDENPRLVTKTYDVAVRDASTLRTKFRQLKASAEAEKNPSRTYHSYQDE